MSSTSSITRARNMAKNAFEDMDRAENSSSPLEQFRLVVAARRELAKAEKLLSDLEQGLLPAATEEWERTSSSIREQ